jgi:hypothetical protein
MMLLWAILCLGAAVRGGVVPVGCPSEQSPVRLKLCHCIFIGCGYSINSSTRR